MILDSLSSTGAASWLPARVRRALEYLRTTDMAALAVGRHDLDGDRLFALVQEYTTRTPDVCRWEAHRRYIDVQYVVRGAERMGYAHIAGLRELEPYDPARDVAFFESGQDFVTVRAGMFAIFTPEDVHAPCAAVDSPRVVRKVVMKAEIGDES